MNHGRLGASASFPTGSISDQGSIRSEGTLLNPGFGSDLDSVIARFQPWIWVHGHMHNCGDEQSEETRVVSNPDGYNRVKGHGRGAVFVVEV